MSELVADIRLAFPEFKLQLTHAFALSGVTALFGQSGSGKSTLLRVIAGHERNASGRVIFDGEIWQDRGRFTPPHRRGIGYVFQDVRLFPHLSVAGNLRYSDGRAPPTSSRIAFEEAVEALDLTPLLKRRIQALSGGERQRVAIGQTLLTRPRLILMDEPLAALDVRRKAEILPYIAKLPSAFGVPIIYVTHAVEEVAQLADRIVVLANGTVAAQGSISQILERMDLQTVTGRFEAGVVLTARVVEHDTSFALTKLDHHGQSILMPLLDLPCGSEIRVRIRARDVALATRRPEGLSVRNVLSGTVLELVEEPDTAFAEVLVDLGGTHLRARVTRHAIAELALRVGAPVFALVKSATFDRRALPHAAPPEHALEV
jgi:molybdate transport system ATP-binding protein